MSLTFQEAARLANLGLAILPVPHGYMEPRFDWTPYQRRAPSLREIEAWLESDVGIGAICGKVSRNLVALEFSGSVGYLIWKQANPGLAARLPIIGSREADYVLFRTYHTTPTGDLYLPKVEGKVGRILGEESLLPLPPTLNAHGEPRTWINGLVQKNFPTLTSLDEVGVMIKPPSKSPSHRLTPSSLSSPSPTDGDKYAHLAISADEYCERPEFQEMNWVVKGLLPETYLAILAGESKAGKSCLVTAMGMAIAKGKPFLGQETTQGGVLWICYEESDFERRAALIPFPAPRGPFYVTHEKLLIDTPEGLAGIRWLVRHWGISLVVIDPLYAATAADSLSDGRTARNCLAGLKDLCRTERTAAIILHHFNKDHSAGLNRERSADSHQLLAAASMDMLFDSRNTVLGREIMLRCRGRGDFANQTWIATSSSLTDYRLISSGKESESTHLDTAILGKLRSADGPLTAEAIVTGSALNLKSVRNRMPELAKSGAVVAAGKVRNAKAYVAAVSAKHLRSAEA